MKCDNKQTLKLTQGNPITRLIKSFSPAFPILLAACGDDPASNSDSIAKIFNDAVIEDAVGDAVAAQCGQGGSSCPDGFECASFSGGQWGSLQLHLGHNDVTSQQGSIRARLVWWNNLKVYSSVKSFVTGPMFVCALQPN